MARGLSADRRRELMSRIAIRKYGLPREPPKKRGPYAKDPGQEAWIGPLPEVEKVRLTREEAWGNPIGDRNS